MVLLTSTPAPLSPFSDFTSPLCEELQSPVFSIASTAASHSPEIAIYHDEESLTSDVRAMMPTHRHLMVALHSKQSMAPPALSWVTDQFPHAIKAMCVVSPPTTLTGDISMKLGVLVFETIEEVAMVCVQWTTQFDQPLTLTSFGCPTLTASEAPVHVPGSRDLMQIDELYELESGKAGVCAVMTLGDVKKLLPQDEGECRSRVLLVKRCHKLGPRCSSQLKSYFNVLLGKEDAVEHVLMLPLKARCTNKNGRPLPPKTGFVVFRDPSDAMLTRALGSEQMVTGDLSVKVETYDGL